MDQVKQVIVIRKDLNMRKGKMVAQGAHASLNAITSNGVVMVGERLAFVVDQDTEMWLRFSHTKITVGVDSEEELLALYREARDKGIRHALVYDEGRTEFQGQTYTALAIGPAACDLVDAITRELKLL